MLTLRAFLSSPAATARGEQDLHETLLLGVQRSGIHSQFPTVEWLSSPSKPGHEYCRPKARLFLCQAPIGMGVVPIIPSRYRHDHLHSDSCKCVLFCSFLQTPIFRVFCAFVYSELCQVKKKELSEKVYGFFVPLKPCNVRGIYINRNHSEHLERKINMLDW